MKPKPESTSITLLAECPICLWPADGTRSMHGLPCGHTFCAECWGQYVMTRICQGASTCEKPAKLLLVACTPYTRHTLHRTDHMLCRLTCTHMHTCMSIPHTPHPACLLTPICKSTHKHTHVHTHSKMHSPSLSVAIECLQCSTLVGLEKVQSLLASRADMLSRFLRYALSDYVLSHSLLRWCPGPDCSIIFSVHSLQPKKVSCSKCSTSCWYVCVLVDMQQLYNTSVPCAFSLAYSCRSCGVLIITALSRYCSNYQ